MYKTIDSFDNNFERLTTVIQKSLDRQEERYRNFL